MERPAGVIDFHPDPQLFPFESRWFDSSVGAIHYVDEGPPGGGLRPLLLLHGNPDWSFLYRNIIIGLRDTFRCIAFDYPGFGLSVHPSGYGYTVAEHSAVACELVEHLDLQDTVIMGQDWGGPIGMEIASRMTERVGGLVMGNTWYWPAEGVMFNAFSITLGAPPMQWLIKNKNLFVNTIMKSSLEIDLTDEEFSHYTDVVPTPESRAGIAMFPRQIRDASPFLSELEQRVRNNLTDMPLLLLMGPKDIALGSDKTAARWMKDFPHATHVRLEDANHYIQEDAPDRIIEEIRAAYG